MGVYVLVYSVYSTVNVFQFPIFSFLQHKKSDKNMKSQ
jgi:hypothetical protein